MPLPLAHFGHYANWFFYVVPVLVVAGAIVCSMLAQRRWVREHPEEESG